VSLNGVPCISFNALQSVRVTGNTSRMRSTASSPFTAAVTSPLAAARTPPAALERALTRPARQRGGMCWPGRARSLSGDAEAVCQ
jgi:hypothetical protein